MQVTLALIARVTLVDAVRRDGRSCCLAPMRRIRAILDTMTSTCIIILRDTEVFAGCMSKVDDTVEGHALRPGSRYAWNSLRRTVISVRVLDRTFTRRLELTRRWVVSLL